MSGASVRPLALVIATYGPRQLYSYAGGGPAPGYIENVCRNMRHRLSLHRQAKNYRRGGRASV